MSSLLGNGEERGLQEIIEYLIRFLAGERSRFVGYGDETAEGKVVILREDGFYANYGKKESLPKLPVKTICGIPVLYGEGRLEWREGRVFVHADLVASSYFMLSGYEEMVHADKKDAWGRFPGTESLACRGAFLDRPVVDEYRILVEDLLRKTGVDVPKREKRIARIHLTHDVDQPWQQYGFKQAVLGSLCNVLKRHRLDFEPLKAFFGRYGDGYLEAFRFFGEQDQKVRKVFAEDCHCTYFVLANAGRQWLTASYINDPKLPNVLRVIRQNGGTFGMHASPAASRSIEQLREEKERLERTVGCGIAKVRNHCLLARDPADMERLTDVGILEDFSCGYAAVAGFRLGTSRAVRYVDPYQKKLTDLLLQPLIVMDSTLEDGRYMNMDFDDALNYVKGLIRNVSMTNGELTLLWHNHLCERNADGYQRRMYEAVIDYVVEEGGRRPGETDKGDLQQEI